MSDFPNILSYPPKPVILDNGPESLLGDYLIYTNSGSATATWPAANRALYMPIWLEETMTALQMALQVATQSGNLDVGIYDEKGNLIVSKGSTAVGAVGLQVIDLTASVTGTASPVLTPGTYFLAMSCDNNLASFLRNTVSAVAAEVSGVQQQASFPLPSPSATFANPAAGYVPCLSLAFASVL